MEIEQEHVLLLERLTAVRRQLALWQVEGILLTSPVNRRWLSGFNGSYAQLLVTPTQALLATDSRYATRIPSEAPLFTLFPHERTAADTRAFIAQGGVTRIGVEANHLTLAAFDALKQIAGKHWIPLEETVEPLRAIKNPKETKIIRAAAGITDRVMAQVNVLARVEMTEQELAWELEKKLHEEGADGTAFPIIVAAGPHSARPHHTPGTRRLQTGDALIIDMGARLDGYHSDLTRTFFLGAEASARFWEIYEIVQGAQTAVFTSALPGMSAQTVDALAREMIASAGFGDYFGHGSGHGLGLEIHEAPLLSPRANPGVTLRPGMIITIEPGIYIPDWGGVRIEDLALVTDEGLETISQCPKNPLIPIG